MRRSRKKLKIENWRKLQKCFVAATVFLLCSMNVAGQEPVDSMTISKYTQTDYNLFSDPVEQKTVSTEDKEMTPSKYTQTDLNLISDSTEKVKIYPLDTLYVSHSPAKAAIMSAVIPGLGQVYNRKYWKVPIVYLAIGISVERFIKYQNLYNKYRRAYIDLKDNDPYTNFHLTLGVLTSQPLEQPITKAKEQFRTWRDYAILAVVITYAMNIIDANVDAHLMGFSLDDNISLNIRPTFFENDMNYKKIGLTLRFTF